MALLEIQSVSKAYDGDPALTDIDLTVEDGEFAVLFGASGSGKSVILRMLVGLEDPDSGTIMLRGSDASTVRPGDRKIGYVPQSFALFPQKSVADNIAYPLIVAKTPKGQIDEAVERVAALLDISALVDRIPGQLSGGQKQRVAIARGLVVPTDLYVLDDPLVGLDFKLREKLVEDLRASRAALGVTFVYATSDATEALALATTVSVLSDQTIQETGRPYEVYRNPQRLATMTTLGFPMGNQIEVTHSDRTLTTPWGSVEARLSGEAANGLIAVVRPEHILLGADVTGSIVGEADVILREDLGAEEVVHLESDGHKLISVVRADALSHDELTVGSKVRFGIGAQDIVLFSDGHRVGQGVQ